MSRFMKLLAVAATVAPAASVNAQQPARLAVVVANGRAHVYPSRIPSESEGWIVLRDGVRLTPEPLTGVRAAEFPAAVGGDLQLLLNVTSTDNALAAYRRLRAGGSASGIAQILSPRTALALGALFVDSTVRAGAVHRYSAELVRLSRPDSVLRRATASVRIVDMVVGDPPTPSARTADGVVSISWQAPRFSGASDDIVVAYTVERADSVGNFARITPFPVMRLADRASGHQDQDVAPGKSYRYRIRAADLLGRLSAPSAVVSVRVPGTRGPLPPPQVAAEVTDGRIRVVWTVSPEPRTRGYHVERSVGGDSTFTRISRALVPGEAPEFTDTLVRGLQIYSYRVRAVDDAGRAGAPSNATTARGLDQRAPAAPASLTITPMPGHRVRLAWRGVSDRDLDGYHVSRAEPGDTSFARLTRLPIRALAFMDSGYDGNTLEPGREYRWRVTAVDSSANVSAPAFASYRLPDDEAPDPVRSILVHNQLGRHVEVTWTASPAIDVHHYLVERVVVGTATIVATIPARGNFFVKDTAAAKGRLATWRVVAVDSAGNRAQPRGDTLTFRDLTKPPAPRRVTATRTAAGGVTTVRWERVVSSDLRGYYVYRAERSDGHRKQLTPAPVTVLEFIDRGGPAGARYVVRAVDASGNLSDEGPVAVAVERP